MSKKMFPQHYKKGDWNNYLKHGYRVSVFDDIPKKGVNAQEFLSKAVEIAYDKDYPYVPVKLFAPKEECAMMIRVDRDYFEICKKKNGEIETLKAWQFTSAFRDFYLDELWVNMIHLLKESEKKCA